MNHQAKRGDAAAPNADQGRTRAPRWLVLITLTLTIAILFMAVAETTLWTHYLVDEGELISLAGLTFIFGAGLMLYRQHRLLVSLPLIVPWLLYPVVTQADQIIDNLTINQMRLICHLILALLFATPIAVLVMTAQQLLEPTGEASPRPRYWTAAFPGLRLIEQGRTRDGAYLMALSLLMLEIWIAHAYLGELMIVTLVAMGLGLLGYMSWSEATTRSLGSLVGRSGERTALWVLVLGVGLSLGLYVGFKNRPGAYQGSPHYYHDPAQRDAAYPIDRVTPPVGSPSTPSPELAGEVEALLADYGRALTSLVEAYYLLDRNYNYAFHNELFIRHTPVLPGFRGEAMSGIETASRLGKNAETRFEKVFAELSRHGTNNAGLAAFLEDVGGYVSFNLRRAALLEQMSGEFEKTKAGLQHATHLYEGEGKVLGLLLMEIVRKHEAATTSVALDDLVAPFIATCRQIEGAYANRIIGF